MAEEARIQAELEAGEAAKQAYWDAQELPDDEAKIVPDLPSNPTPVGNEAESSRGLVFKLGIAATLLLMGVGAAVVFL